VKISLKNGGGGSFHDCLGVWGGSGDHGDWGGPLVIAKVTMARGQKRGLLCRISCEVCTSGIQ